MDKDTFFQRKKTLNVKGRLIDLSLPKVMGIINITPDSFYSGSRFESDKEILNQVTKLLNEGVDMIDIGGYSTKPGAIEVNEGEETKRLIPAIKSIVNEFPDLIISVDTFRAGVAEKSIDIGAHIINDVSGGTLDPNMFATVGKLKVPYVLMHMRGNPQNMNSLTDYDDLISDITYYFSDKIAQLYSLGVKDIILDPGFGFSKTINQNYQLLNEMDSLSILELPILAGLSRKSMIWKSLNIQPELALNGTTVLNTIALQKGANILRVHDVKEAKECIELMNIYNSARI
jgi:dihydropteroate synthase